MVDKAIKERIGQIIKRVLKKEVNEKIDLFDQGLNSVNVIEIIVSIEDEFNIEFSEDTLSIDNLRSMTKIYAYVVGKLNEKNEN